MKKKRKILKINTKKETVNAGNVQSEMRNIARDLVSNAVMTRTQLVESMMDQGGKDINQSCGYPSTITPEMYTEMYAREGVGARIVDVWPEETWSDKPSIYENEDAKIVTPFETKWRALEEKYHVTSVMARADALSGVGKYGVILLGVNDGKQLNEPVEGVDTEDSTPNGVEGRELLYIRPFMESAVKPSAMETNVLNPRFGKVKEYQIEFTDGLNQVARKVHWSRIVHLADRREMSEIEGVPRMQKSYNRLLDIRKILGGSGEMFWKGGFPGYSFEVDNDGEVELDKESLREEMQSYMNGLQRYLALEGVKAKSLAPQVEDPKGHLACQLDACAMTEGIPKRILFGSEQAELASSQDTKTWNRRVAKRQKYYASPYIIRPVINRLISIGILPYVETYFINWEDLNTTSDKEKADVARAWAEALAKFVQGDVEQVIPIQEFLSILGSLPQEQVKQIMDSLEDSMEDDEDDEDVDLEEEQTDDKE